MLQVAIAVLTIWLSVGYLTSDVREQQQRSLIATASAEATSFLSYRRALVEYVTANPGATGAIDNSLLTFQPGHVTSSKWNNIIENGRLFVYSTVPLPAQTINATYEQMGNYPLLGVKSGTSLISPKGAVLALGVPSAIADGSMVCAGL